jgi:hypothetical protein
MKRVWRCLARTAAAAAVIVVPALGPGATAAAQSAAPARKVARKSPVIFQENRGQFAPRFRYAARGSHAATYITADGGLVIALAPSSPEGRPAVVSLTARGATRAPDLQAIEPAATRVDVFRGSDPKTWIRDIPTSRRVRVHNLYEGVDVEYYGTGEHLEYDFVVAPGATPAAIRLHVDNAVVRKGSTGELVFHTAAGDVVQRRPVAYQISGGVRHEVPADYNISGADITFSVADYDGSRPLVIDPVLLVATYLGGSDTDQANAVAFGPDGLFVAGSTVSPDLPTSGSPSTFAGQDAFVAKYSTGAETVQFIAYYGGNGSEEAVALASDGKRGVYVAGNTTSTDLPVTAGAPQRELAGSSFGTINPDGFLAHFSANGDLVLSTYFGSDLADALVDLAVGDDVYIVGQRAAGGWKDDSFPIPVIDGSSGEGFLFRLSREGVPLAGRLIVTHPSSLALGPDGAPYVGGTGGIASAGAFQSTPGASACLPGLRSPAPCTDGFVARFEKDLSVQAWGTFLREASPQSNNAEDKVRDIAVDASFGVYVVGNTLSASFPVTPGALQTSCGFCTPVFLTQGSTGFVTKIDPTGSTLEFSTFLGGSQGASLDSIAVDSTGVVFVGGTTDSADFPIEGEPLTASAVPGHFLTALNPTGTALVYSTWSDASLVALSRYGSIALAGSVFGDATVLNAAQPTFGGGFSDGFLQLASIPRVVTLLETPAEGGTTRAGSVTLRGFAADTRSTSGAGIDSVHVYAYAQGGLGPAVFLGTATVGQARNDVGEALGTRFGHSGFTLTASLAPGRYLFAVYGHSSVTGTFGPPAHAIATALRGPILRLESPAPGISPDVITISGVALDLDSASGTGADAVHVWAYPSPGSGAAPQFLGAAPYGLARPDVAAAYGDRFANSGFSLVATLAPGPWLVVAYVHSKATGLFSAFDSSHITVPAPATQITFEAPTGPVVYQGFHITGTAFAVPSAGGSGIDAIHAWAYPNAGTGGSPLFLGSTTTMLPRRDVATAQGASFLLSGFDVATAPIPAGKYLVVVFARNRATGRFEVHQTKQLEVRAANAPVFQIEEPGPGDIVPGQISVTGFAFDPRAVNGLGVDAIHVWVYPNWGSGAPPYFCGLAYHGQEPRTDLGQSYGTNLSKSGFATSVTFPVGSGTHLLALFAHDTETNSFTLQTRLVTVPEADPIAHIDLPTAGTIGGSPIHVAGWMIDRAVARLTKPLDPAAGGGITGIGVFVWRVASRDAPTVGSPGQTSPPQLALSRFDFRKVNRPDVGAVYGDLFTGGGFDDAISLPPGSYDVSFVGYSAIRQQMNAPSYIRITVQ